MSSLIQRAVDALNRHGRFTARPIEHNLAIEIRYADTGIPATKLWSPKSGADDEWVWGGSVPILELHEEPAEIGIDELVAKVAASLPKRGDR